MQKQKAVMTNSYAWSMKATGNPNLKIVVQL